MPLIASWFAYPITHLPPGFGQFPPQYVADAPGFNKVIFCIIAMIELGVLMLLFFPQLFGFKKVALPAPTQHRAFPICFWLRLVTTLLKTSRSMASRYSQGPKLSFDGNFLLYLGLALLGLMVFVPYALFWVLWVGVLLVFSGLLIKFNIWSPFTALAKCDWTPMVLIALASMLNGFVWEFWNYGSAHPEPPLTNPNYWQYDILMSMSFTSSQKCLC